MIKKAIALFGAVYISISLLHAKVIIKDLGKNFEPLIYNTCKDRWFGERNKCDAAIYGMIQTDRIRPGVTTPGLSHHIIRDENVNGGNTSFRNESKKTLVWKGKKSSNGYGYYQRNRDLGQVFYVDTKKPVKVDSLVLRTSRGNKAIMQGALGAKVYVQFFKVTPKDPKKGYRINNNGTTVGDQASHGFRLDLNRADDYVEGAVYTPIHKSEGGVFPDTIPPTTQTTYDRGKNRPFGEQQGHLRFFRIDFEGEDEITLEPQTRYAFMVGFEDVGDYRGIALAIEMDSHTKEYANFVTDGSSRIRWGIRREGKGRFKPIQTGKKEPPTDKKLIQRLVDDAMFAPNHWETLKPTSNGYPDVSTYITLQFYLEVKPLQPE